MDIIAILALVAKGLSIATAAIEVGKNAIPAVEAVKDLVTAAQTGNVTDQQLTDTEEALDSMLDDFNKPIV